MNLPRFLCTGTMKYWKKSALAIVIYIILVIESKCLADTKENYKYAGDTNIRENGASENPRGSKILWPYPKSKTENPTLQHKVLESEESIKVNNYPHRNDENNGTSGRTRQKRFFWPYQKSPIADMMMQTFSVNYKPTNPGDPFDFLRDSYPLPKGYNEPLDIYDYVIVGAGSAGSVLAARLTEDKPKATVLLLEAGKPEMVLSDVPALAPYMKLTDYVWPYSMEKQPGVCMGSEEQRCFLSRGKAVGGTSVVDYMVYSRGRPEDWNRIASDGNYGWSYNEVLEYFKKSENSELKKYKNLQYRGRDGELTVENVPFKTLLVEAFLEAGRRFGNPTVDYNAPDQLGFGYVQTITNKGHRLSSAKAFLHPHKRRKNLHILTEARATKVLIDPQSKRAYGVEYQRNGLRSIVRIRREVILSAGPVASPQLLMLSGVGPKQHLQSLGIPVVQDLQVGRTMYDHIGFPGVVFRLNSNNASLLESKVATLPNLVQWIQYGDGLLTTPGSIEAIGYLKTRMSNDPQPVPDIELINLGASITLDSGGATRKCFKISDETYNYAFGSLNGVDTWSVVPALVHPKSKGYLELRDSNPFSQPKLFGNYYTNQNDLATMKEAIKYIIQLGESEPFRRFGPRLHLGQYPSCITYAPGSDSYWDCALRTLLISLHNPVGTCKMGPQNDLDAVVDPELRVYGVEGLRVVDSSVLPKTLSTHTSIAAEIMIGEKAADMIRRTWSNVISNNV